MSLSGVPATCLETLMARAYEGHGPSKARVATLKKAGWIPEAGNFKDSTAWDRYCLILTKVMRYVRDKPDATILCLGSGMSFYKEEPELAGHTGQWFDIDLPEVMEGRRLFPEAYTKSRNISANAAQITRDSGNSGYYVINPLEPHRVLSDSSTKGSAGLIRIRPDLVIAEGLLMYLPEMVAQRLLGKHTIFDVMGSKRMKRQPTHRWFYDRDLDRENIFDTDLKIKSRVLFTEPDRDQWLLEVINEL